jgi:hypothetical protein
MQYDSEYNSFVNKVKKNYEEMGIEYDENSKKLIFLVEKGFKIPSMMIEIYQFFVDIENESQSEEELQKKLDQLYKQARKMTK